MHCESGGGSVERAIYTTAWEGSSEKINSPAK